MDAGIYQQENPVTFVEIPEARSIAVYLVDPTTGFPAEPSIYSPTTTSQGILPAFAVGDFNGDGLPDVAVLGLDQANFAATVAPFLNVSQPTGLPLFVAQPVFDLGAGSNTTTPGLNASSIVSGSFRAIDPDIALLASDGVTLLENQGLNANGQLTFVLDPACQGTFTAVDNCYLGADPNFPGLPFTETIHPPMIAADVNGDGYADIVVAIPENCDVLGAAKPRSAIYVLISNGDGTFKPPIYVPSPVANPVGLAFGKLMGTASNDIVVVNGGEQCSTATIPTNPGAALLANNHDGSGTFGSPLALFLTTATSPVPFVSSVAVADMNKDGTPDVVISANDGIHVLLNSKSNPGAFTDQGAVPLYATTDNITNAALIDIADVNLDTFPDVVATIGGNLYVFLGDGAGGLGRPVQGFSSGPNSYQLKAIDVNGDGSPDVLVSNSTGFSAVLNGMAASTGSPLAQFNEVSLSFGGIAEGVPETLQFILANTGTAPLLITNIAFANSAGNEFTYQVVTCTGASFGILPMSIPAGANCTFNVLFTPNAIGPVNVQMLFYDNATTSNAPDAPATTGASPDVQTIQLTGAGLASQANTLMKVTGSPSVVAVGTPILEYTITLSNPGPSAATNLTFSHQLESSVMPQSVAGSQGSGCTGPHTLGALATCSLGTLPANSSATVVLDVSPTAAGTLTNAFSFSQSETDSNPESVTDNVIVLASLSVTIPTITENIAVSDAPTFSDIADSEMITVTDAVSVTPLINVTAPVASFSPSNVGFGSVSAGVMATQTVVVFNTGVGSTSTLTINGAPMLTGLGSPSFQVSPPACSVPASFPINLPSGGSCAFTISYTAPSTQPPTGAPTATLTFSDNAALSNVTSAASSSGVYVQAIALKGSGASSTLGPPPAIVTIQTINEPITVTDAPSFSEIFVQEPITVTDKVSVTVSNPCAVVVSAGIIVMRGGFFYSPITRQYTQTVTLTNSSAAVISGPVFLLIEGLSGNATLLNSSGRTTCNSPGGIPYVTDSIVSLAPGSTTSLVLRFSSSNTGSAISYSTAVEAGSGAP